MANELQALTTQRLVLRPVTPDDTAALFAITSDPETWRHAPEGRHENEQTTRAWIERAAARWDAHGLSYWLVRVRATGEVIGVGGVQRQATGNWNLYYRFSPVAWGHGYVTELGTAALAAANSNDPEAAVIAWVREDNTPSRRVAERLGLTNYGLREDPSDRVARLAYADRPLEAGQ